MTTTTSHDRPAIEEMYVVHRTFRREFGLVPGLVRAVREGDTDRAAVVGEHLRMVLAGLHMHHTGEDEVLWPLLLERATLSTDLVHTMQEQHDRVDGYAERIQTLVVEWLHSASTIRGEQLARLVEDFRAALLEHLELEEREILPICLTHVTAAEWASLGDHGRDSMRARDMPLMFGAVLEDATEEERAMMLHALPAPVRLLLRTWGGRRYRRYITRVRGE